MEQNGWTEILESLAGLENDQLQGLLDSSRLGYDGNFTIVATESIYSGLCQYYPLIETLIQDKTGKHLRLNLEKSVPVGTESTSVRVEIAAASVTDAILKPDSRIVVEASLDTNFDYLDELGFEIDKFKKYKTNMHVFIRKK